jgi:hypothetical protein
MALQHLVWRHYSFLGSRASRIGPGRARALPSRELSGPRERRLALVLPAGALDSNESWGIDFWKTMTAEEDIATVASQLAALTHTVEEMAGELKVVRERAESERERGDMQQERIDLAARELADVSERLQAAANALRESI